MAHVCERRLQISWLFLKAKTNKKTCKTQYEIKTGRLQGGVSIFLVSNGQAPASHTNVNQSIEPRIF